MTMWGFSSRKDQDNSIASTVTTDDHKQLSPTKRSRRRIGRRLGVGNDKGGTSKTQTGSLTFSRPSGSKQQQQHHLHASNQRSNNEHALRSSRVMNQREWEWNSSNENPISPYDQDINVDATDSQGIEILLDYSSHANAIHEQQARPRSPNKGCHHSRRSMSNHKGRRSAPPEPYRLEQPLISSSTRGIGGGKVAMSLEEDLLAKRTKLHRAQFSVFFPIPTISPSDPLATTEYRRHRIPLDSRRGAETMSYGVVVQMLQNATPLDEMTSVRLELKRTTAEWDALEEDKEGLEQRWLTLHQKQSFATGFCKVQLLGKQAPVLGANEGADWDIHRLLCSNRKIGVQERANLELKRGRCITIHLENTRSEDSFLNKCCGVKHVVPNKTKRRFATVTVDPFSCRPGGAGATIRHLALLPKCSSFFVSRDHGKSYSWGQLPPRFLQRMKSQGLDPVKHCGDLIYLSTGPNGSYFAEFRTGESWWGYSGEDKEFYEILQKWDVYRVVFGASVTHTAFDAGNHKRDIITNSWIVLGRDGRAVWKNLPSRLHQTLEGRLANSAAPAEVALGAGDSYYVRFLDGTVDYCLPAQLASVCERIQRSGGTITDMALNPEVSDEFLVRHTEIPSC